MSSFVLFKVLTTFDVYTNDKCVTYFLRSPKRQIGYGKHKVFTSNKMKRRRKNIYLVYLLNITKLENFWFLLEIFLRFLLEMFDIGTQFRWVVGNLRIESKFGLIYSSYLSIALR